MKPYFGLCAWQKEQYYVSLMGLDSWRDSLSAVGYCFDEYGSLCELVFKGTLALF